MLPPDSDELSAVALEEEVSETTLKRWLSAALVETAALLVLSE